MSAQTARFVVIGAPASGKTAFISSVSGVENADAAELPISESLRIGLSAVPLEAERSRLEEALDHAIGIILVVDSTQPMRFAALPQIVDRLHAIRPLPIIIAANKQDLPSAQPPATIRQHLPDDAEIKVFPCVATDKSAAEKVLLALIYQILG